MTTKQKVETYLAGLEATMYGPDKCPFDKTWECSIDAPHGFVWTQSHTHCVRVTGAPDKATFWQWVWKEIEGEGVVECDARPNCDICDYDEEDVAA